MELSQDKVSLDIHTELHQRLALKERGHFSSNQNTFGTTVQHLASTTD